MPRLFPAALLTASLTAVLAAPHVLAQPPERFTAGAINMNNGRAGNIEIVINRWSTEGERGRLMQVMMDR